MQYTWTASRALRSIVSDTHKIRKFRVIFLLGYYTCKIVMKLKDCTNLGNQIYRVQLFPKKSTCS